MIGAGGYLLGGGTIMGMGRAGATGFGRGIFNKGFAGAIRGGLGNFMAGTGKTKMGALSNLFRVGGKQGAGFSAGRLGLGALGATAIAAPFFMGGDEDEEEVITDVIDPAGIRQSAKRLLHGNWRKEFSIYATKKICTTKLFMQLMAVVQVMLTV